jgi:penicillin-binding protein 1A
VQDAAGNTTFQSEPLLACPECAREALPAVSSQLIAEGNPAPAATVAATTAVEIAPMTAEVPTALPPPERRAPQAISPANAYVMTDMMADVIERGTATRARELGRHDLAGKTGTTSDRRDTWFVGFNAALAAAAWIGFDQERSLGEHEEGAKTALPMWIYFMEEALRDSPEQPPPEPPGVVRMWVSRDSGAPTHAGAPGAQFEAFLETHAPQPGAIDYSDDVGAESVEPATTDESLF